MGFPSHKGIMKAAFLLALGTALTQSEGLAEIIHLRDGRVIDEKIVERGSYYIVTMKGNVPTKYFNGQIDYIEEAKQPETDVSMGIDMEGMNGISSAKAKLILDMVEASGVRRNMEQNMDQILSQLPEGKRNDYRDLLNVTEIIKRILPVYDKYYSEEDLREMIRFYESPVGKKIIDVTPQIMKDTVTTTLQYFQEKTSSP